ncbi:FAD-dependent thymidylate synthase [Heliobacterium chlorum]|uniref:FAD-dependent thymidylate synthase n=1 Tax=Heliobacterium chlorum TaxID=2698 RepID=A0ABR7T6C8_HELCL|nr:FAD-dependent thymidylate synthase [Heliobacterium chlorum]MBC9785925.1 FAD-dependent thymidylate synthase [Heliobacterium chlorum]
MKNNLRKAILPDDIFSINLNEITGNDYVFLNQDRQMDIARIEYFINRVYRMQGFQPVQKGRVIALRYTDRERLSSAFAAALYLGKYDDMDNTERFLKGMVRAGHSYEPIRGETISFLYIGVSKPAYDHLITYTLRNRRIAGGLRANKPWGYVIPKEAKNRKVYKAMMESQLAQCEELTRQADTKEQLQAVRSLYPTGVILPPFMFDFSEEALAKNIFQQRLWEPGAQGETKEIVQNMFEAVRELDLEKWDFLQEYHGEHMSTQKRAMRKLREQRPTLGDLLDKEKAQGNDVFTLDVYKLIMEKLGKVPKSMWD